MFGYRVGKRMEAKKPNKHNPDKSEYFGKVGDKIKDLVVEITKTRACESSWGVSLMVCGYVKGTDNQFVSFLSGSSSWLFDGETLKEEVTIAATVKGQQDRGYGKQTSLTRMRKAK